MNRSALAAEHLERSGEDSGLRRALAARLDMALKRAGVSSARLAKWVSVSESDVLFWRRGITVPPMEAFKRIAASLNLDFHWLCTINADSNVDSPANQFCHKPN
ncbi:MAG TPA: helix-turn-helix transcriptional regulator [Paraburkholderia sp.]|uniref:helix-turn-helix transcriptional regulator n=1 Tax=Paraburkholderia sp. TaxID=1926495 RepID=UPI002B45C3A0|nr:helix-turn-helix transcriptional regulator [Paraburkholderia sp.]HKR46773.1 helix-turn-helix transcriptional regulator [Paraburkholderia sp.]